MSVGQEVLEEQSWSSRVLDRTKWSRKEYIAFMVGFLVQAFLFSFEANLYYGVIPTPTGLFDATSLTAILPTILQIVSAVLIPFYTKVSDVIGRAEALSISLVFYVSGYIIQGLSNDFGQLAAGQLVYAVGYTGFLCLTQILVVDATALNNRGIYFALWGMGSGLNIWTTQLLIDPLTVHGNWRHSYIICTTVAVAGGIACLVPLWHLQRKGEKALGERPRRSLKWFLHEFDVIGATLLTVTLSLLLFPLIVAGTYDDGFGNPVIFGCLIAGGIALVLLVLWEGKFTDRPILPMRIWTQRTCFGGLCGHLISTIMSSANWMYFTVYLVVSRKLSFGEAFLLERGYQMGYLVFALITGFLMKKYNASRRFVWIGFFCCALGTALMIPARLPDSSDSFVVISQTIVGIGGGMTSTAALVSITGSVHRRDYAVIIGANQILGSIGSALAGALAGGIWTQMLPARLAFYVEGEYNEFKIMNDPEFVKALPEPMFSQVIDAYSETQKVISIVSCSLVVLAGLATLMMEKVDLSMDQDTQDAKFGGTSVSKDVETPDEKEDVVDEKK
ncbi:hypothetical protein DFQ26_006777 [Actinomortierella ambigua]|nr:hypothetical protein DFQ26_006777 [Actinomortierella ambigua]